MWHELHNQFANADAVHEPQLQILFRGAGDLMGGLAQALSRGLGDDEDDDGSEFSLLDEIQFGLTVTQLKRALRGLAFARGALFNLRSIVSQPDCDRFHETLKRMAHDITAELQSVRERFQGDD